MQIAISHAKLELFQKCLVVHYIKCIEHVKSQLSGEGWGGRRKRGRGEGVEGRGKCGRGGREIEGWEGVGRRRGSEEGRGRGKQCSRDMIYTEQELTFLAMTRASSMRSLRGVASATL